MPPSQSQQGDRLGFRKPTSKIIRQAVTLTALPLLFALASCDQKPRQEAKKPFNVVEATIPEMQAALKEGRVTSRELVTQYLTRIGLYEDKLHATVSVDPNVLAVADQMDKERAEGHIRGPLHGIPIALKDNIMTTSMPTSGGALAFKDYVPPYE